VGVGLIGGRLARSVKIKRTREGQRTANRL
jgi:hypothetical protein